MKGEGCNPAEIIVLFESKRTFEITKWCIFQASPVSTGCKKITIKK